MISEYFIALFTPHECLNCGVEGDVLCQWCCAELLLPVPDRCVHCSALSRDSAVCARCRRNSSLRHTWIRTEYEGAAKQLIQKIKFSFAKDGARTVARTLAEMELYLPPDTIVAPVPTASGRVRRRGYDQAALIARHFSRDRDLQYAHLLWRVGQSRQLGATAQERRRQAAQFFRPRNPELIKGRNILLIDDVVTTGATLEAAAQCVRKAGARKVDALVFAQRR